MTGARGGGERWDFFIAHASADKAEAEALWDQLTTLGHTAFLDKRSLKPGDQWGVEIPKALARSDVVVALVSSRTPEGYYAREEVTIAIEGVRLGEQRVVPVYVEDGLAKPYGLAGLHSLFVRDGWDSVVDALAGLFVEETGAPARVWCRRIPRRSPFFVGRDDLLSELANAAGQSEPVVVNQSVSTLAVAGSGGIGKTTLAAMHCHDHRDEFDVVWWVRAENSLTLVADLVELARPLGLGEGDAEPEDVARLVVERLESEQRRWLVVFDNVPTPDDIREWLPQSTNGQVVITSRHQDWVGVASPLAVPQLTDTDAATFLCERVRSTNPVAADEHDAIEDLVRRLGGLPLALEHAGAHVAKNPAKRFANYLDRYAAGGFGDDPMFVTWQISIEDAGKAAPLAPKIMAALAFCAPDAVPEVLFSSDDGYLAGTQFEIDDALDSLHTYSLIRRRAEGISVHRVVQDAARSGAGVEALNFMIHSLKSSFPETDDPARWTTCAILASHVLAVAHHDSVDGCDTHDLWRVLNDVGNYLRTFGSFAEAIIVHEQAAHLAENHLGPSDPDTLTARANLAFSYWSAGQVAEAIALEETVLADRVELSGARHPDTLTARANLAASYQSAGRTTEAIPLQEAVLADSVEVLGARHPDTLMARANLAASYNSAGRVTEAIPLQEAVVADREDVLGARHPATLTARANLAGSYWSAGRVADAIALDEAVLADRAEVLGARHPDTLSARAHLAASYWSAGRVTEAIPLEEAVLADRLEVLGARHPDTLMARANLAFSYWSADRVTEAIAFMEDAIADAATLDFDHPQVDGWRTTLAGWKAATPAAD